MAKEGKHGVTTSTTTNIMFGAGTIHKGLKYTPGEGSTAGSWNFTASVVGATSGGSSLKITPEVTNVEVDGVLVKTKGFEVKTGEVATMDINLIELTKDIIKASTFGTDGTSTDTDYDLIEGKSDIAEGDYWDNIAFVGKTLDNRLIIAILDNALCTSGLTADGKNKEGTVGAYTFESHADPEENTDMDYLPWHIYYPHAATSGGSSGG